MSSFGTFLLGALAVLAALACSFLVGEWAYSSISARMDRSRAEPEVRRPIAEAGRVFAVLLLLAVLLGSLGLDTRAPGLVLAAIVVAVALIGQGPLGHGAAGAVLFGARPFRVGDVIRVGADTGKVVDAGWFFTTIETEAGELIHFPNRRLLDGPISNKSRSKPTDAPPGL